jgi:hypothetical protein
MNKPLIKIHNVESDEVLEREMTNAEFVKYQKLIEITQIEKEQKQAELETRETARQAILDRLGLTADEAKLILG